MITDDIIGDDMQAVIITLAAGAEVRADARWTRAWRASWAG
jgi:hypothetical protein